MVKKLAKTVPRPEMQEPSGDATGRRFTAKGLASHRKRLGLTADELGSLVGASGQTIYNWEGGTSRPRTSFMPAIAALRTLGKKQARSALGGIGLICGAPPARAIAQDERAKPLPAHLAELESDL